MTISDAARTGDRRATLEAMRDRLAADMDLAPPTVIAQIAGRLSAILAELDDLATGVEVSALDELDRRRQDRIADADGKPAAPRKRQRRA